MITFVTFYVPLSMEKRDLLRKCTASFAVSDKAPLWIDLLFRSARHFHPGCRCVLLTDEKTEIPALPGVEIIRSSVKENDPLWSRLTAERDYLRQYDDSRHIAFVDFDVLVNAALTPVFDECFDVGLTYRRHESMPINAGVMLVRAKRCKEGVRFFNNLLRLYEERFNGDPWWGEQKALTVMLGKEAGQESPPACVESDGVRIRLLPGTIYNHTPHRTRHLLRLKSEVVFLHFKGDRKTMMRDHWEANHLRGERPCTLSHQRQIAARLRLAARAAINR